MKPIGIFDFPKEIIWQKALNPDFILSCALKKDGANREGFVIA
jgi:hypothetical protein